MTTSAASEMRKRPHTRFNPCPICGGGDNDPRGQGVRCDGFTTADGSYAHCSREERRGALGPDPNGRTYAHRLNGPCACGEAHTGASNHTPTPLNTASKTRRPVRYEALPDRRDGGYVLKEIYPYHTASGDVAYEVRRYERASDGEKTFRIATQQSDGLWVLALEAERVLYRLPALLVTPTDAPVVIVEGEKCVAATHAALRAAGFSWPVTTTVGGEGQRKEITTQALAPLAGRRVVILPDHDEAGEKYATTVAERARHAGASAVVTLRLDDLNRKGDVADWLAAGHDGAELAQLVEATLTAAAAESEAAETAQPQPLLITLADVAPERPRPLWAGYLWLGKIAVLDGDPGLSKSTITLDLAARVSRGRAMPDGSQGIPPAHVILLSAEDGAADTIRPRLDAADGDPRRVHLLDGWQKRDADTGEIVAHGMTLPGDSPILEAAIRQVGAQLVVIDPLMAFLNGDVNSYRDQDVRGALRPLAVIAERSGACVIIVRHLNKAAGGNAIYRGGGSIGIIGAARSGLLVAPDPDDPDAGKPGGRRVLALTKTNLGLPMPALGYRAVDADGAPRIEWLGAKEFTPAQLLALPQTEEERSERTDAVEFLREALASGERRAKEIGDEARSLGISDRKLKHARHELGVKTRRDGGVAGAGAWLISLPKESTDTPKESTSPDSGPLSADPHDNAASGLSYPYVVQPSLNEPLSGPLSVERCPVTGGEHETAVLRTADGWLKCIRCDAITKRRAERSAHATHL